MSHFSVMVLTEMEISDERLDSIMAPFDENKRVPEYILYTKEQLIAKSRKEINDYKNTTYAEYLKDKDSYRKKVKNERHLHYLEYDFPKKLNFTDEECYQDEIMYIEPQNITSDGSVLSTYNPLSKWDWYVVGGRFSNMLKLKNLDNTDEKSADEGFASEIDFSPNQECYERAIKSWQLMMGEREPENDDDVFFTLRNKDYYLKRYGSAENYASSVSEFSTYAVIMPDGSWLEPGPMGMFGLSFAEIDDEQKWDIEFKNIIKEAVNNNWYVTIVDCHI